MNEKLQTWLDRCALTPGMFGCGVRLPDGACVSHNFNELSPQSAFDEVLLQLGSSLPAFSKHGLAPRWLTWTFQKGQLRAAQRADGFLLALASLPDSDAAKNLDLFTEDFLALDLKS